MTGRIVFCKHAVETLTYFSRQLAEAFEAWGYEIFWMDLAKTGLSAWKLRQAVSGTVSHGAETVLITFNFIGLSGEEEWYALDDYGQPAASIWEQLGIRCLNILVDHPIYYYRAMQYPLPEMQVFCIDRDHVAYMKRFYPQIPCAFLPIAGNRLLEDGRYQEQNVPDLPAGQEQNVSDLQHQQEVSFEEWDNRLYPLIFTANYVPIANLEKQLSRLEPEYRDFYDAMIQSLMHNPNQDLLSCIEGFLRREIPDLSDAQLCEGMSSMPAVDLWVRTCFREKTIQALADGGVKIYLFGKDWEQISCRHPENLIVTGRMVTSAECVRAAMQAKISLNTMPWFKDGAHDRVFTSMLCGAAALTDDSRYLREQFADLDTIVYYGLQQLEALPQQVTALLADPQRLFALACRGKRAAVQCHQWKNRAAILEKYAARAGKVKDEKIMKLQ